MLSWEEQMEMAKQTRKFKKEVKEMQVKVRNEELKKQGINLDVQKYETSKYDSPYALEKGAATVLWLIIAVGGLIFNDGWILSIIATVVWFNYITRHINISGGNDNE